MKLTLEQFQEITLVLENEGDFYRFYSRMEGKTFGQRREAFKAYTPFSGDSRHWMKSVAHIQLDVEDRDQLRRYFDERYALPQDEANKYAHIPDIWAEKVPEAEAKPSDYTTLPDGVILITANGNEYVKGKVANCGGGNPGTHSGRLFGARASGSTWCHWDEFGWTKSENLRIVSYRIPADQFTPAEIAALKAQGSPPLEFNRITLDQVLNAPAIFVTTTKEEDIMTKAIKVTTKTFVNDVDVSTMTNAQVYDLIAEQEAKIRELHKIENKPKRLAVEIEERQAGIDALVAHLDAQEA